MMKVSRKALPPVWRRRTVLAALGAGLGSGLAAANAAAPTEPAELQTPGVRRQLSPIRLQGQAKMRFLGLSVYEARLWVGAGFDPQRWESSALALELIYARRLKGEAIASRSIDEMTRAGSMTPEQERRWRAFMQASFPDVNDGDRLTGLWLPGEATVQFFVDGAMGRSLKDAQFGQRFFGIWLAESTSEPKLREQLLGLVR